MGKRPRDHEANGIKQASQQSGHHGTSKGRPRTAGITPKKRLTHVAQHESPPHGFRINKRAKLVHNTRKRTLRHPVTHSPRLPHTQTACAKRPTRPRKQAPRHHHCTHRRCKSEPPCRRQANERPSKEGRRGEVSECELLTEPPAPSPSASVSNVKRRSKATRREGTPARANKKEGAEAPSSHASKAAIKHSEALLRRHGDAGQTSTPP